MRDQTPTLVDGNDTPGGALYVGRLLGVTLSGKTVTDIMGSKGLYIYYDFFLNPDLGGLTYDLAGGGWLAPVGEEFLALNQNLQLGSMQAYQTPLPASCWLFLSGLVGLGLLGRRRQIKRR